MDKNATQPRMLEGAQAPLPAERAFVVQFRAQADPRLEIFIGRAEHIASGVAERFASSEALIAFMTKILAASKVSDE